MSGSFDGFVHRKNLEHYRRLLEEPLDPTRRKTIQDLLAEEERKEREDAAAAPPPRS
ncbi:MAG: hypothetical protein K2Y40_16980 [Reyranella sp.]|nr:hypothetical protein [Reyranella sp.]